MRSPAVYAALVTSNSARASVERPFYATHADAYDLLITDPVEPWVDAVHDRITRAGLAPAAVLDAGCGTGRHAAGIVARGHAVDLADASPNLLALAAQRCPSARAVLVDLCAMVLPSRYDAVTCRGVLNDMTTDAERTAAVQSLCSCLKPGGLLVLDVRDADGSRQRADGAARVRQVDLGGDRRLTFVSRTTWADGLLQVDEEYALSGEQPQTYRFTMRPWTARELYEVLHVAGARDVEISEGVGRLTPDRRFVVARASAISPTPGRRAAAPAPRGAAG